MKAENPVQFTSGDDLALTIKTLLLCSHLTWEVTQFLTSSGIQALLMPGI